MNYAVWASVNGKLNWYEHDGNTWDINRAATPHPNDQRHYTLYRTLQTATAAEVWWLLDDLKFIDQPRRDDAIYIDDGPLHEMYPLFESYARML